MKNLMTVADYGWCVCLGFLNEMPALDNYPTVLDLSIVS